VHEAPPSSGVFSLSHPAEPRLPVPFRPSPRHRCQPAKTKNFKLVKAIKCTPMFARIYKMHPFQYTPQHPRIIYKNPPIVERVVSFAGDVSPEAFYGKFDTWKNQVEESFPEYDPLQEWSINVQEKDGVPLFENAEPVVHITHRFWRRNQQKQRLCSMRLSE
jgi:hypothetical protein